MTSASSTRSESPADIDFSVIRTSIEMGHKMIDQILNGIHYGSDEVRNLLREECDFILECKVCRNLFRSFPNFVAHKRVYCMEYYEEKVEKDDLAPVPVDEETVVVQPEAPEDGQKDTPEEKRNVAVAKTSFEKVINRTFEGKSKEYQFYTKVAANLEKRKVTKVTNTVTLTPIASTSKAVEVIHSKGDKSVEIMQGSSPKKQSPVKMNESTKTGSPGKKKTTVLAICADLTKKVLQGEKETASTASYIRVSTRSRKSSPRKSIDYFENTQSDGTKNVNAMEDMDVSEWTEDINDDNSKVANENTSDEEWVKFCDVKNTMCRICKKSFSSLYNLKFHAKMKHVSSVTPYACPHCDLTFDYFTTLARHLRKKHHKSDSYINNIKMKLQRRKSTESMETDQDDSSSSTSSVNPSSPQKMTGNLLSYSTGWKKCDKCGKVCWKAKSFYRHYAYCKGPMTKESTKSATNSPVKLGKPSNVNGGQRNSTALLKLQEKLRAGVIQPTSNVENTPKTKLKDRNSKSESDLKINDRDKKTTENNGDNYPELFKTLTKPFLTGQAEEFNSKQDILAASNENNQGKTYNLRVTNQNFEEDKAGDSISRVDKKSMEENDKCKEVQANNGSPAFKKLEERLVREAGLKEMQKPEKIVETTSKPYSTRHAAQTKGSVTDSNPVPQLKEAPWKGRNLSGELNKDDNLTKVKEQRVLRESPEIKELEEKLTREALGHKKQLDEKETNKSGQIGRKDKISEESSRNEKRRSVQTKEEVVELKVSQPEVNKASKEPLIAETGISAKRRLSKDAELRKEKISERLREKMTGQELNTSERKKRLSRSESKEKDTTEEKLPDKTPEKMRLMMNLSPVSSPSRTQGLPSSPTPSVQSSSGDSYNMKFKMTVQEMAELVESASLTKFAKERKKKARKILNTKQAKESAKMAASLSKPMKRQVMKRNIIIRNVYGTRNKKGSELLTHKAKKVYSTRSSTGTSDEISSSADTGHENLGLRSKIKSSPKSDTSAATESTDPVSSSDSFIEKQAENKRLSREQKRLLNSAGFVEKNFYAVTSIRDSSKDKPSLNSTKEKNPLDFLKYRHSLDSSKGMSSRDSSTERLIQDSSKDRPSRDSSKDEPSQDSSKNNPLQDSVKQRLSRDSSKDRPSRNSSKDRPSRDSSKDRPSRDSSNERSSQDSSKILSSQDSSKDKRFDAEAIRRGLAREIKRLESSQGFVDKGFHYESDSSIDRESHTSSKLSKNIEICDAIHHAGEGTKVEKPKVEQLVVSKEDVTPVRAAVKNSSTSDTENVKDASSSQERSIEEEKLQKSSVKKTVLYIGKDLTERIRSIQERKADVKQENTNSENENNTINEPDNEQASQTQITEKVEVEQAKALRTPSVANKTKIFSTRNVTNSESQSEESGEENKGKKSRSSKQNLSEKNDQSEFKESKKISDPPKHRTRLATGSIFFDSELLKLSPTKAEKKVAELSKTSEIDKGRLVKRNKIDSGRTSVKKRLSLSPRKEIQETKSEDQIIKNIPQRYALSTGVKQCQKCNRKFWKKRAYVIHMTNSPCSDKKIQKFNRKRALSLSPGGIVKTESKAGTEIENRGSNKKSRTEVEVSKNLINENKSTQNQTKQKELINEDLKKKRVEIDDRTSEEKLSKFEKEYVKFVRTAEERVKNETLHRDTNKLRKDTIKDQELHKAEEENNSIVKESNSVTKSVDQKAAKPTPKADDILKLVESSDTIQSQNKPAKSEINENLTVKIDEKNQNAVQKLLSFESDKGVTEKPDEFQVKSEQHSNTVSVSDEIPGPSTGVSSVFTDDSDDNGSEFSGFSENDLRVCEQELTQMEVLEQEDIEDEDLESEDDLDELSDDINLDDELNFDVKPTTTPPIVSQRPVRKSAQNRFAHVEEIWIYKEPGKSIIEKTKGVKNREYVLDLKNPSKLQCHNSKDVDKLIDEKNLKCRQCETPCTSISNLRRHVIRHLGWKRYKCKHCTYTCYDMSYCRQHVLRAHDEKLTSKNFNEFIIDLKKEATKKRAAKRTSTLHKSRQSSIEEDAYKKLKTSGSNTAGKKANLEQTYTIHDSNVLSVKDSRKSMDAKDAPNKEPRKSMDAKDAPNKEPNIVLVADFIPYPGRNTIPAIRKSIPETEAVMLEQSPLDKARMNLAKALCEKK